MTRVHSLSHGIKEFGNPYTTPIPLAKSAFHRVHRSKKNQNKGGYKRRKQRIDYKKRLEELSTPQFDFL